MQIGYTWCGVLLTLYTIYRTCSLYPGLPVIQIPAKFFKSWAVWQNEKDSVLAESQIGQQGATLKSQ